MAADPQPLQPSQQEQQEEPTMDQDNDSPIMDPDDPLLIAQTLTYVTDNGSVVMSYSSAPFSKCA